MTRNDGRLEAVLSTPHGDVPNECCCCGTPFSMGLVATSGCAAPLGSARWLEGSPCHTRPVL